MKLKKLISLVLSLVMMASLFAPVSVFAGGTTTITIPGISDTAGSTVDVAVQIENNPGILGATLTFEFDEGLTLVGAANGDAFSALTMTKPGSFTSPCNFVWDGQELTNTDILDGVILTLQFKIPDDAQSGTKYNITASYDDGAIVNNYLNPIDVNIINGSIEVLDFTYGDLNSDKKINTTDVIMMRRHIAGGYTQMIKEQAADVNIDTKINATDVILTRRYIAGGYGITLPYLSAGCNHVMEAIPAKEATEEEEGNIAYWHCKACDKYFGDVQGRTEISLADTILPKNKYSIQYACDMAPRADDTYTYGIEKLLPAPTLDKYTFVGWSDEKGKIWKTIPAGTTGNLILYANWSSDRNKAIPVEHLSDPTIMEDSQNGLICFSYKIGKIVNVPLYQMSEILTANGVETEITTTRSTSQKVQTTQEMTKTLSEATTNSTSWVLSNNWNNVTEVSERYLEEHGLEREEAETLAKNSAGSYTVGYQSGGTSGTTSVSNKSYAISNNEAQHREFEHQNENSVVSTVDHKFNAEVGASFPISVVNVNAKVGYGYENSTVTSNSQSDRYAGTSDWSTSSDYSASKTNTSSNSKSWNSTSNSTSSWSDEKTQSVRNAVSEMVTREYNTNKKYELGGSESNTIGKSTVTGEENKLSSTILYDTTEITTEAVTYRTTGNTHGGYRIVLAGTLQVYAVVIYDIATSEYSVQTYSVLGDGSDNDAPKPYLDYSWEGNQFTDYQTSVIPFEIPYEVNGYVNSLVAKTDGIQFNPDNASVTRFNNDFGSELVYIPTYIPVNNGDDTYSFTKITSLSPNLFNGDTTIKAVRLGNGITEIPDGAFEGCTNLTDIYAPNVTKIGSRAFAGCKNLNNFTISEDITEIGSEAFEDVPRINAMASNINVAQAVTRSGAKNIVLNISIIPDEEKRNIEFNIGNVESFELRGGGNEYPGLSITSDAKTTILNRITFTQNTNIPIILSSENVTLDQVSVDCTGYALVLKADSTKLTLNRTTNSLLSSTGIAALCKNIDITETDGSIFESGMQVMGDILVCDSYSGDNLVKFNKGEFKVITNEEYENYLSTRIVSFDANGGVLEKETDHKIVPYNGAMGELPVVSRDYYTFDGWYKNPQTTDGVVDESRGEEVTSESLMTSSVDITLYAHWVLNDVSAWTPASELPEGAEVVDTKYSYTQTHYTESSSTSLSGWSCYDSYWVQSGSGYFHYANFSGYNMNGRYSDFKSDRWYNYETETNKRDTSAGHTGYIYMHWCQGRSLSSGPYDSWIERTPTNANGNNCYTIHSFDTSTNFTSTDRSGNAYKADNVYDYKWACTDSYYWYKIPYYTCWYTDYYKVFKYTKSETKESVEYPTGNNISNIQEWVQYRIK